MTLFLSHRGESDDAPENTLASFALAAERQSDGIELDIRLTADGYVVVVHDKDLTRVSGSDAVVSERTLDELQKIHPVPLLSDVLKMLPAGMHLQIELKGEDLEIVPALKKVLDDWNGDFSQLALSSFEEKTISLAGKYFGDLPRVLLVDLSKKFGYFPSADETAEYMRSLGCTGVSFKADMNADAEFVRQLHLQNMRVVCWGVFTDDLGIAMANAGVDALTCNHAVALRNFFRGK